MTELETMKRQAESLSLQSPRSTKYVKTDDTQETGNQTHPAVTGQCNQGPTSATTCDSGRGNITIIHAQSNGKHGGSRMQWTFPRTYLAGRTRSVSPQSPDLANHKADAEFQALNLNGSYTPDGISVFYEAITTEGFVSSSGHSLHEYCQIYALAQFFGVHNIFQDSEGTLLRKVMGDDTPLDVIRAGSSFASMFRWRALVERCRFLLARRVNILESDLRTMNCGGLNILATKLDETYDFLSKSGFVRNVAESKVEQG